MKGSVNIMTMGEKIAISRKELGLTQEQLGQRLNPPVNRAAVHKWEKGWVKNIKRSYIEQLAMMFGEDPVDLMCFEFEYDEFKISKEVKLAEDITEHFGKDAIQLLQYFSELNELGRQKALNNLVDLTEIPKYTE
jgi:transcriptional regulator with XRE-family HTH domain